LMTIQAWMHNLGDSQTRSQMGQTTVLKKNGEPLKSTLSLTVRTKNGRSVATESAPASTHS
jgi:hypothetical protein